MHILFLNHDDIYMSKLDIEESFRGKGYGDIFMDHIISFANTCGKKRIYLIDSSDRARQPHNIYEKHGFIYTTEYYEMCLTI